MFSMAPNSSGTGFSVSFHFLFHYIKDCNLIDDAVKVIGYWLFSLRIRLKLLVIALFVMSVWHFIWLAPYNVQKIQIINWSEIKMTYCSVLDQEKLVQSNMSLSKYYLFFLIQYTARRSFFLDLYGSWRSPCTYVKVWVLRGKFQVERYNNGQSNCYDRYDRYFNGQQLLSEFQLQKITVNGYQLILVKNNNG